MRQVYGSRLLNENGSVLGLNALDLVGGVSVLVISAEFLRPIGLEVFAVPLGCLSLITLIPIRLRYRRKIIRDSVRFILLPKGINYGFRSRKFS